MGVLVCRTGGAGAATSGVCVPVGYNGGLLENAKPVALPKITFVFLRICNIVGGGFVISLSICVIRKVNVEWII